MFKRASVVFWPGSVCVSAVWLRTALLFIKKHYADIFYRTEDHSFIMWINMFCFRHSRGSSISQRFSQRWSFRLSDSFRLGGSFRQAPDPETESWLGEENEVSLVVPKPHSSPSMWRLLKMNSPEWPYAVLGSIGAIMAGGETPLFALAISQMLVTFYNPDQDYVRHEVRKICLIFAAATIVTVLIYLLQHYFYGLMGEVLTMRVRKKLFSCKTRLLHQ